MRALTTSILMIAAMTLTACNSVNFSPAADEFQSQGVLPGPGPGPAPEPGPGPTPLPVPVPLCAEGDSAWVGAGTVDVECPGSCADGTRLRCPAQMEKQLVCVNGDLVENGQSRVATVGGPVDSCPITPPAPTTKLVTESFDLPGQGKADILVILDTTGSMTPELNKLSRRFANLTASLAGVDWQLAVTNAGSTSGFFFQDHRHGKFFEFQGHPQNKRILKKGDSYVDYYFKRTIGREDDEGLSDSGGSNACFLAPFCMLPYPKPLLSLTKAINEKDAHNKGFFRKDSYLVPLVISDADEHERGGPEAVTPAKALQHFKDKLGSTMKGLVGFGIVIRPGDEKCLSDNRNLFRDGMGGHYGTFVHELARQTDGFTLSLCDKDFGPGLSQISERVRERISTLELKEAPIDGQVEISITPASNITWKVSKNKITFSRALPANARVQIRYRVPAN